MDRVKLKYAKLNCNTLNYGQKTLRYGSKRRSGREGQSRSGRLPRWQRAFTGVIEVERIPGAGDLSKNLPCMKVGRAWRLRRETLEQFMGQSGRPETLTSPGA